MATTKQTHDTCILTNKNETLALDYKPNGYAFLNATQKSVRWILVKQCNFPNAYSIRPANNINMCLTYSEFKNAALVLPINQNLATQYWGISHYDTLYSILDVEKELDLDRLEQKVGARAHLVERNYGEISDFDESFDLSQSGSGPGLDDPRATVAATEPTAAAGPSKNLNFEKSLKQTEDLMARISVKNKSSKVVIPGTNKEFTSGEVPRGRTLTVSILKNRSRTPSKSRSRSRSPKSLNRHFDVELESTENRLNKKKQKILKEKLDELQQSLDYEANSWVKAWEKTTGNKFRDDLRHVNKITQMLKVDKNKLTGPPVPTNNYLSQFQNNSKSALRSQNQQPPQIPARVAINHQKKSPASVTFNNNLPSYTLEKQEERYITHSEIQPQSRKNVSTNDRGPPVSQNGKVIWIQSQFKRQLYKDINEKKRISVGSSENRDLTQRPPQVGFNPREVLEGDKEIFRVYL